MGRRLILIHICWNSAHPLKDDRNWTIRLWKEFKVTQNCDFQSNVYILKIRYKFGVFAKSPNFPCFPHAQAGTQASQCAIIKVPRRFLLAVLSLLSEALPFYKWGN